jgi:membrane protein implicated in regulation of membrane protease activity
MIEYLASNLLWWHWIVLGLILVVSEIVMPLFIVIWFGLSAMIVGLMDLAFSTSFMTELLVWIVLSVVFLGLWFAFFKDKSVSKSGQSDMALDTKGIVTETIREHEKGKVRFDAPVLGSSKWFAVADEELEVGTSIHIIDVKGQLLKVQKD